MYKLTIHGKTELENELVDLRKSYDKVVTRVAEARAQGDLSENAEYENARDEQGRIQSRIDEVEDILKNAEVIAEKHHSQVEIGSTVVLSGGVNYEIVGSVEASPADGKISDESPLGRTLLGKKVGDEVVVKTPKENKKYTIEKIV